MIMSLGVLFRIVLRDIFISVMADSCYSSEGMEEKEVKFEESVKRAGEVKKVWYQI